MNIKEKKEEAVDYLNKLTEQHQQVSNAIQQVLGRIQTYDEILSENETENSSDEALHTSSEE